MHAEFIVLIYAILAVLRMNKGCLFILKYNSLLFTYFFVHPNRLEYNKIQEENMTTQHF